MSTVKLGPFSELHYSSLIDKLAKANVTAKRIDDIELLNQYLETKKHEGIIPYPTYSGAPEFIYLEVETKDLLIIKGDLDAIGQPLIKKEPVPSADEYLCPRCKYVSASPGFCPKHNLPLLEFSKWVEFKRQPKPIHKLIVVLVLLFFGFLIYMVLK